MKDEPTSRQAQWAKAKRAAAGLGQPGRPPTYTCGNCSGHRCRITGSGDNRQKKCVVCEPPVAGRGRPRTRNIAPPV